MNLALWLHRQALARGKQPALARGTEVTHDYAGLARAAVSFADAAVARGVRAGDRVGVFMDNDPGYLVDGRRGRAHQRPPARARGRLDPGPQWGTRLPGGRPTRG